MVRFQFAGVRTKWVPYWLTVLFQVCRTDSPAGKSKSIFQSLIGAMLALVTVKFAMKPVCQVEVTDNVAAAAA